MIHSLHRWRCCSSGRTPTRQANGEWSAQARCHPLRIRASLSAPERLARPHVFVILVDGLRRQVIEPDSREAQWAPFLSGLARQAEQNGAPGVMHGRHLR